MRNATIARNYAETLLALATKAGDLRGWGKMIGDVATAMQEDATLKLFLESPRIPATTKIEVLSKAFQDRMPRLMVRFLQSLVKHRRQMLIPDIFREYMDLVDEAENRMHARGARAERRRPEGDHEAALASVRQGRDSAHDGESGDPWRRDRSRGGHGARRVRQKAAGLLETENAERPVNVNGEP